MECLDGLAQLVHTGEGAFVVASQVLRRGSEDAALRLCVTDGFVAWYEIEHQKSTWANLWREAGDASEEAFARRVLRGFEEGMLDPFQASDKRSFLIRVDSLSTVSKVIEFTLRKVPESEKGPRLQGFLQTLVGACQNRRARIAGGSGASAGDADRIRQLEADNASLRQLVESSSLSPSQGSPFRPPSPIRDHRHGARPMIKRPKGHSIVNPHVKRSKAKGSTFSDDLEPLSD